MIFILLLLPLIGSSAIVKDDVLTTDKLSYSFQKVCQSMVKHETPLIEVVSGFELDCMGKKISVDAFCEKEMVTDPYYLRAYIKASTKEVICHSGKKVFFKFQCLTAKEARLCDSDAKVSCGEIKNKLAKRLDMVHASVTKNEKGFKELNCSFESLPLKKYSFQVLE